MATPLCVRQQNFFHYLHAGGTLVQTALVAISITLAVYCCKVINCCSPGSRMVRDTSNSTSQAYFWGYFKLKK